MSDHVSDAAGLTPSSVGLQRPQIPMGWADRQRQAWRGRAQAWRERAVLKRERPERQPELTGAHGDPPLPIGADRRGGLYTGLIAVGAALLALGSLWGWQTWSQRSSEPIDDLLPVLTAAGSAEAAAQSTAPEPTTAPVQGPLVTDPAAVADPAVVQADPTPESPPIIVHISGAVRAPGIVELAANSRVFEAVAAAGGASIDADLNRLNLAAPLGDGERIHVPMIGEDELPVLVQPQRPSVTASLVEPQQPDLPIVDINAADMQELQQLPGVGPSLAQAIVRTREARGPFLRVDELLEVPGIGDAKLAALAPQAIVVSPG